MFMCAVQIIGDKNIYNMPFPLAVWGQCFFCFVFKKNFNSNLKCLYITPQWLNPWTILHLEHNTCHLSIHIVWLYYDFCFQAAGNVRAVVSDARTQDSAASHRVGPPMCTWPLLACTLKLLFAGILTISMPKVETFLG